MHIKKLSKPWIEAWLLPVAIVVPIVGTISLFLNWYIVHAAITELFVLFFFYALRKEQRINAWLIPAIVVVLVIGAVFMLKHWHIFYAMVIELAIISFFVAVRSEHLFVKRARRPRSINLMFTMVIILALLIIVLPVSGILLGIVYFLPELAYRFTLRIAEMTTFFSGLNVRFDGRKTLPVKGQCVVGVNHTTLYDLLFAAIIMRLRPWTVIYASKLEKRVPIIGQLLKKFGVAVYHDPEENKYKMTPESKAGMEEKLDDNNQSLIAFIEGRRILFSDLELNPDLKILPLDPGAILIARKRGLPFIPCVIYGGFQVKPRYGQKEINPGPITICIGDAIQTAGRKPKELIAEVWAWMDATYRRLEREALTQKKLARPIFSIRLKWFGRDIGKRWEYFIHH